METRGLLDGFDQKTQDTILAACERALQGWTFRAPNSGPFLNGYEMEMSPAGCIITIDLRVVTTRPIDDWRDVADTIRIPVRVLL